MDSVIIIKIISALLYPLGVVAVFAILSLICRVKGNAFAAKSCAAISIVVLFGSSNPMIAQNLVSKLEQQYPQQSIESIPKHDAIIVLGGGLRIPLPPATHVQLGRGSDRYWYAAQLFQAGKADTIVLAGGNLFEQPGLHGEAYYAAQLLQKWGVPESAIKLEQVSRTTAQNKDNIVDLVRAESIQSALLVTSAIHMPRAYYVFSRMPISITPASADVLIRQQSSPTIFSYLPSASAMQLTTMAMHEHYGLWYEWLKPGIL